MIKDGDFDTPLPDIDPVRNFHSRIHCEVYNALQTEDCQPWQPVSPSNGRTESPMQSRVMSTFCAVAKLGKFARALVDSS